GQALERFPEAQRPQMVLDLMIDMHLLADAAQKAGIGDNPIVEQRTDYYRTQTLRDLYMEDIISRDVTEDAVRERYETEAAQVEPRKEVSARHILVADEDLAKDLIAQLNDGGDFAALAEEHSMDPGSKARGGSLGFFGQGQMVKPFEDAAFALEPGQVTPEPVQSQFGFHVIQVDDTRVSEVPGFDQVGGRIRDVMIREAFMAELERLKEDADIVRQVPTPQ
ncbi:MAG: peptidylprolyl isomerase, partial [Pseudomonadota bacterium]